MEAYCPIVRGQRFGESTLKGLAKKYAKTEAQVLIRWSLQMVWTLHLCRALGRNADNPFL